ncbi:MAG: transcription antitermination factor NusB [Spirochaetota bacterium]|nr:transcription antitermination factor NusB [Spirochaetota bacterium]
MGQKRKARVYALQALYMYETTGCPIEDILSFNWIDREVPEEVRCFASSLIEGSIGNMEYIDNLIRSYSKNWRFERLGVVDKSILRISIYALIFLQDIPFSVTINEGIELGKTFGGEGSRQYINGILDAILKGEIKGKNNTIEDQKK